jgi:hypothetical protein
MSGVGLAAIIGALAAPVAIFIYGKAGQKKELQKNEDELLQAADRAASKRK